ncbi:hypothetical protein [Aliiroseovarius sp. F20344]|uniref:hypothetical protein n=1 Tax=Aliiroseovarius sp. F20344 TaxID=2926414 RepID=UPI001FF5AB37|nr:hypothetical protein [Aliiroseovarius sp. F20344]MCK0143743.1 hypothetical protein [Aliiroseovarius sp. F20344]
MLTNRTALAALAMAGAVWMGATQTAQAGKSCNLSTAKLSLEPAELCECKVVTTQMLRYIQRQDEFLTILDRVNKECPAFADALTSLPTATTVIDRVLRRDKDEGSDLLTPETEPDRKPKPDGKTKPDGKGKEKPDTGGNEEEPGDSGGNGDGGGDGGGNGDGGGGDGGGNGDGGGGDGGGNGDDGGDGSNCGGGGDGSNKVLRAEVRCE